jgi:hypothetical protein
MKKLLALFALLFCAGAAFGQCNDAFAYTGALNGSWTVLGGSLSAFSGVVKPTTGGGSGYAVCTGGGALSNDQTMTSSVAGAITDTGGDWVAIRMSNSGGGTGYFWNVAVGFINKLSGGSYVGTITTSCPIIPTGHTFTFQAVGTSITCKDVTAGTSFSVSDSSYSSGYAGISLNHGSGSTDAFGPFTSGDYSTQAAAPTFSPSCTGSYCRYATTQSVTMSCASGGTAPHYTTDGSIPNAGSTLYTAPLSTSANTYYRAVCAGGSFAVSDVTNADYLIGPQNWYVGVDGGSRYNPGRVDGGMCDGLTDQSAVAAGAPYDPILWEPNHAYALNAIIAVTPSGYYWKVTTAGTSQAVAGSNSLFTGSSPQTDGTVVWTRIDALPTNLHCRFREARFLWSDGAYTNGSDAGWAWVIQGGDTVMLRGSIADGASYRVGWTYNGTHCDANGCWGVAGNPQADAPSLPSGTMANPTRFLGENYAACSAQTSRTQLHGGWNLSGVLILTGTTHADIQCLDITDFSGCRAGGYIPCKDGSGNVIEDFAIYGIKFSNTSTDLTLNNIRAHGMSEAGFFGPTGGAVVVTHADILGNAGAGWDADDHSGTGVGSLLVQNFDISWNGCAEEYPITHSVPYEGCRDQSTGGAGDGFGTATADSPSPGWQIVFDQGTVSYNMQDGLDALHVAGPGSTITETRVLAFGNEGQQLKAGGATATIQNSAIYGNCEALTSGTPIPGRPSPTGDSLGAPCRAGNTAVLVSVSPGVVEKVQDNTFFSAGAIAVEFEYANGGDHGPTNVAKYDGNIFVGSSNGIDNPTPIFSNDDLNMLTNPGGSWSHNSYYGWKSNWTCPNASETNALCVNTQLTDMTYHVIGYGDVSPATSGSPVYHAGVPVSGVTVDYNGTTRNGSTPSIGACEPFGVPCPGVSTTPTAATPTFSPVAGTYGSPQSVTISTSTSGATICYTIDGSTPTANGSGTCTHGTTYSTAVSVSTSLTLKAIASKSGNSDSATGSAAYVLPAVGVTFSPGSGTTSSSAISVTLTTATSACSAYIVWNSTNAQSGGDLTGVSSTNPLTVSTTGTRYAQVQGCPGYLNSPITNAGYTVTPSTTPGASGSGAFSLSGNVTFQ